MTGVDFDSLVNSVVLNTFGEASRGVTITYTRRGGATFPLSIVFDAAWSNVEMQARGGVRLPVSTTKPAFGCRLSDFPDNLPPKQGDTMTRSGDRTYTVSDVMPDGVSGWFLVKLN